MSKIRKVLLYIILPIVLLWIALSVWAFSGPSGGHQSSQGQQVGQFNDGYRTAMQDGCQQHEAYACQWLATP